MITHDEANDLFLYRDGSLFRKKDAGRFGRYRAGSLVGSKTSGYLSVRVNGELYFVHRIIWLLHHGYIPENDIDHINKNRSDNRIENLREISHKCNIRNSRLATNNTSSVKGISWCKRDKKWKADIKVDQKPRAIGRHSDFTEAVAHRLAAEQCLNWSSCDSTSTAFQYMKEYLHGVAK